MRAAATAAGALVASAAVFAVRGVPTDVGGWRALGVSALVLAGIAGITCSRWKWVGFETRDFARALPLADPAAALPTPRPAAYRSFSGAQAVAAGVTALVLGLLAHPLVAPFMACAAVDDVVVALHATRWERRHGVLLWRGRVPQQPLGPDRFLYSSPQGS
ncbi:hypothetical protein [Streptomyces griseosporeus]|uniref:hypothetical protein n=1 Tax=Streptomyces griseosporeus TaxID=1910 RepID=UPI0036FA2EC2